MEAEKQRRADAERDRDEAQQERERSEREDAVRREEEEREDAARRDEEEREDERRREEAKARQEEALYRANNPGDYKCPECLYITLKRDASRCRCGAVIHHWYWLAVDKSERQEEQLRQEAKERAAEKWERERPAREAAEAASREAAADAAARKVAAHAAARQAAADAAKLHLIWQVPCGLVVGCVIGYIVALVLAFGTWAVVGIATMDSKTGQNAGGMVGCLTTFAGTVIGALYPCFVFRSNYKDVLSRRSATDPARPTSGIAQGNVMPVGAWVCRKCGKQNTSDFSKCDTCFAERK